MSFQLFLIYNVFYGLIVVVLGLNPSRRGGPPRPIGAQVRIVIIEKNKIMIIWIGGGWLANPSH